MKDITVIFADAKDEAAIKNLLLEAGLPHEDISNHLHHFLVKKHNTTRKRYSVFNLMFQVPKCGGLP